MKPLATAILAAGMVFGLSQTGLAQQGAKAMFYDGEGASFMAERPQVQPKGKQGAQPSLGLKYWIELVDAGGQRVEVTTDHLFRSGDRIKMHLETNRDGYLYLLNVGSTGRYHLLFPQPQLAEGSNFVKARTVYEIPAGAHITFDDHPGEERLVALLSPHPMTDPALRFDPRTMEVSEDDGRRIVKTAQQKGAKDLTLEVDTAAPAPGAYAVASLASLGDKGLLSVEIKLRHR
jgi:hypothetical protein